MVHNVTPVTVRATADGMLLAISQLGGGVPGLLVMKYYAADSAGINEPVFAER